MKHLIAALGCGWLFGVWLTTLGAQPAKDLPEDEIEAALILGFVRYAEWPAGILPATSLSTPIVIGVQGRPGLTRALARALEGKSVAGRSLAARDVSVPAEALQCNVLFLSGGNRKQLAEWISPLYDLPVLTISDASYFHPLGGIVQLYEEDGKIRFAVRIDALSRSRILVSAKLLRLGQMVRGSGR